ncbi:MAG TPA: response regulator transcription factor [Dehalococcoidia bacterium]|nr:response regulator transcription factor [Dehalococcoidia bacterium]
MLTTSKQNHAGFHEGRDPSLVLVADDDEHIVELVSMYLRREGYEVEGAYDGDETLRKARELHPDLLVLDIMMPGPDGLQICRTLGRRNDIPIILLTARTSDIDKIAGLRLGADDYVTKPFNPEELIARVGAVLRRTRAAAPAPEPERIQLGGLTLELAERRAVVSGRDLPLTPKEYDLLSTMARFPGVVLDREQLLDLVWGTSFYAMRTVDVHVARLREKLRETEVRIETVWGTGYRLVVE